MIEKKISVSEAIIAINPSAKVMVSGHPDGTTDIIWEDTPEISKADIDAKIIELQAEYDAQEYARNRQAEYPDWGVQLEKIDDDGLTRWREEMIDPVKSKWPKDNSGPK